MSDSGDATMEKTELDDTDDIPSLSNVSNNPDRTSNAGKETTQPSPIDAKYDAGPPNGGLKAWLQVAASFFLFFNTW
jgi:hypothetical protein